MHELVPETPLRHGHAISIDMAYSATLANNRKLISDSEHRRILNLFSRAGLSMDHHQFDETILDKGTAAILKTRDGKLRAAVPNPIGTCTFLNDVSPEELNSALRRHKEIMKEYPRNGEGLEAYVDVSDTGYTENNQPDVEAIETAAAKAGVLNGNGAIHGGSVPKGHANGVNGAKGGLANGNGSASGFSNGVNDESIPNGHANGINGIKTKLAGGNGATGCVSNGVNGFKNGDKA